VENQKQVSHAFQQSLESAPDSHFHRLGVGRLEKWKTNPRFSTFPPGPRDDDNELPVFKPKNQRKEVGRYAASSFFYSLSLRSSGKPDFMLILRLENALARVV
jgi:hypothetical protein